MCEGEKFDFGCEQRRKLVNIKSSVVTHWQKAKARTFAFCQELPWHQITMMLHDRQKNYVTFANELFTPGLRHQVDTFGGAAREDDILRSCRTDVLSDAQPRVFVSVRRTPAQCVQSAMNICVIVFVKISHGVDNSTRLL